MIDLDPRIAAAWRAGWSIRDTRQGLRRAGLPDPGFEAVRSQFARLASMQHEEN